MPLSSVSGPTACGAPQHGRGTKYDIAASESCQKIQSMRRSTTVLLRESGEVDIMAVQILEGSSPYDFFENQLVRHVLWSGLRRSDGMSQGGYGLHLCVVEVQVTSADLEICIRVSMIPDLQVVVLLLQICKAWSSLH